MSALADKLEEADRLNEISDLHAKLLVARQLLKQAVDTRKGVKCAILEDTILAFLARYPS